MRGEGDDRRYDVGCEWWAWEEGLARAALRRAVKSTGSRLLGLIVERSRRKPVMEDIMML